MSLVYSTLEVHWPDSPVEGYLPSITLSSRCASPAAFHHMNAAMVTADLSCRRSASSGSHRRLTDRFARDEGACNSPQQGDMTGGRASGMSLR